MKRFVIKCPKCGREQHVDVYEGAEEVQDQVREAFGDDSVDSIKIGCPCGGEMDLSAELDIVLGTE